MQSMHSLSLTASQTMGMCMWMGINYQNTPDYVYHESALELLLQQIWKHTSSAGDKAISLVLSSSSRSVYKALNLVTTVPYSVASQF